MIFEKIDLRSLSVPNLGTLVVTHDNTALFSDGEGFGWHLLTHSNEAVRGKKILLRLQVQAHPDCCTDFCIHHWGRQDVAVISRQGAVIAAPMALNIAAAKGGDDIIHIDVSYNSSHGSIMFGTYKGEQQYQGHNCNQYFICNAEYAVLGNVNPGVDDDTTLRLPQLVENYLKRRGWDRPAAEGPVASDGSPLPYITYPAQSILAQIARPETRVFEFGCGHSSLWWSARVKEVVSVDHDPGWISLVERRKPDNLTLVHCPQHAPCPEIPAHHLEAFTEIIAKQPLSGRADHDIQHGLNCADFLGYAATLIQWPVGYFDVIVVDGMARSICAYLAGHSVKPDGLVVIDNSDRWQYWPGFHALQYMGFGRIDFFGIGPVNSHEWCTSLFAKSIVPFCSVPPRQKPNGDLGW